MSRLGKGLGALIPMGPESTDETTGITTIEVEHIHPNHYQPRAIFDQEKLQDLANSLKENGMIQPIIVTKQDNSSYELIAGERRLEAAKLAKMAKVPVIIRSVSKQEQLQFAIIENIQRENLNAIEEAMAYQRLVDEFSMTHDQVSEVMGKNRVTISNMLRLLKLPEDVQVMLLEKKISAGHARAVLQIIPEFQTAFAKQIILHGWSVRQAEQQAKTYSSPADNKPVKKAVEFKSVEKDLKKKFNLKIKISDKDNKGKIIVHYTNEEERAKFLEFLQK